MGRRRGHRGREIKGKVRKGEPTVPLREWRKDRKGRVKVDMTTVHLERLLFIVTYRKTNFG